MQSSEDNKSLSQTIDDRFDGFVDEVTTGGTKHIYFVKEGIIYEMLGETETRVCGRVVRDIVYKYDERGNLKEIGRIKDN